MAVLAIAAAGGAVGFGIGGLAGFAGLGASIGWSIGSYVGNMLFGPKPPTIEGPRMRDTTLPAGAEGSGIPIVYGTMRVMGQVIWSTEIIETKTEEEVEVGKGGGQSQTTVTYSYSVSYAVGLCEGPITGIRRIWADSKLIYSVSENADPPTFLANVSHGTIRAYSGSETQTADPTIAAYVGAANTPAFRGYAYLVLDSFQLADFGNHRPMIEAEVVVGGETSFPTYGHAVAFDAGKWAVDSRRNTAVLSDRIVSAGAAAVYRWDATATAPWAVAYTPTALVQAPGLGIDTHNDQIVMFEDNISGASKFVRWDASTGAIIDDGVYGIAHDGGAPVANGRFHYDPIFRCWWGLGSGFATSYLYLIRLPETIASGTSELILASSASFTTNNNPLIDSTGQMWFVFGPYVIKASPTSPQVFDGSSADTYNAEAAFIWKARNEIWWPRASNHSTNGWRVFDIDAETFSDSTSLGLGSWTVSYQDGVENQDGHAWFCVLTPVTNGFNGTLRDTSGTEVRGFTDLYTESSGAIELLNYLPGVILVNTGSTARAVYEYALEQAGMGLDEVVTDICARTSLTTIDVNDLVPYTVRGFQIARPMSGRSALEPLMGAFSFDGVEEDGNAVFVVRGGASAATLTDEDLMAQNEDGGEIAEAVVVTRGMETELPATLYLQFNNIDLDYNVGIARSRRLVTDSEHVITLEMPIVFTSEEAHQAIDRMMRFSWLERERYQFSLRPRWRKLSPTDVVTLPDGRRVRITTINYETNGPVHCEGVSDDDGAINSYAEGNDQETGTGDTLGSAGLTIGVVGDWPLLTDVDNDEGLYFAGCGENEDWTGAVFYVSRDQGNNWAGIVATDTAAKIGVVMSGVLCPSVSGRTWDHESRIVVRLNDTALSLSSASGLDAFYNGENAAAVGVDGEWEIVQYYSVTDNGDDTYTLWNFLRGRKGTEWAIPLHTLRTGSSTKFVALAAGQVVRANFSFNYLDTESLWKSVTFGGSLIDEAEQAQTFQGVSAKPLAPCEVSGVREANGDWRIRWTRRARELAEWRNSSDVPLDESAEEYELIVYDSAFLETKRTVTVVNTTGYKYTTSSGDFGYSPSGLGLGVRQLSDRVGYGYRGFGTALQPMIMDAVRVSSNVTLTNSITAALSGYTITRSGGAQWDVAISGRALSFGKHYFEFIINSMGASNRIWVGITSVTTYAPALAASSISAAEFRGLRGDGDGGTAFTYVVGDTVMFAWDVGSGLLFAGKNGTWQNSANPAIGYGAQFTTTLSQEAWSPFVLFNITSSQDQVVVVFDRCRYTPPAGYLPIHGETVNDNPRTDLG